MERVWNFGIEEYCIVAVECERVELEVFWGSFEHVVIDLMDW